MKFRLMIFGLLMTVITTSRAGEEQDSLQSPVLLASEVFKQMPDSVIPSLSVNNRLDMIDFMDSGMKAEVTNLFGKKSEMLTLADDSLSLRVSDALTVHMFLLTPSEVIDSCSKVICLLRTYNLDDKMRSSETLFFTPQWRKLSIEPHFPETDFQRIAALNLQTILKWEREILKKD